MTVISSISFLILSGVQRKYFTKIEYYKLSHDTNHREAKDRVKVDIKSWIIQYTLELRTYSYQKSSRRASTLRGGLRPANDTRGLRARSARKRRRRRHFRKIFRNFGKRVAQKYNKSRFFGGLQKIFEKKFWNFFNFFCEKKLKE